MNNNLRIDGQFHPKCNEFLHNHQVSVCIYQVNPTTSQEKRNVSKKVRLKDRNGKHRWISEAFRPLGFSSTLHRFHII